MTGDLLSPFQEIVPARYYRPGEPITFSRDNLTNRPSRDETAPSDNQTFPRDVDAFSIWGFSPSPTPRPTTPCFSPPSTSPQLESCSTVQIATNQPSSDFIQPLSVAHELLRFQSKRRKQLSRPRNGVDRPSRRLPQPPFLGPDATLTKGASTAWLGTFTPASTDGKMITAINTILPLSKPKSRPLPLPPTSVPKPTSPMKNATRSSFLALSSP